MTYKSEEVGRSIINYASPVWSTNIRGTNYINILCTQHEALRIAIRCHKMSGVDHLHIEAKVLKVRDHSELLAAHYLARCLEPGNVSNSITTKDSRKRWMKEALFTRHRSTIEQRMVAKDRKTTLRTIETSTVNR